MDTQNIINSYKLGFGLKQIATSHCTTAHIIKNILLESGYKIREGKICSPDIAIEIVRLYNDGISQTNIAIKLDITKGIVYDIITRNNIKTRTRTEQLILDETSRENISESDIISMFSDGIGIRGIYERLNVSIACVNACLAKHGVKTRNRSEQQFARMARATDDEIAHLVKKAHDATRGRKATNGELIKRALTLESRPSTFDSKGERDLAAMLLDRGINTIPQKAIGRYNCDLAAYPVAVEVFGGHWHWHGDHLARTEERVNYMLNQGWTVLMVANTETYPITNEVADYISSYIERFRSDPTIACEYRVIWGAGKFTTCGGLNDENFSIKPPFTNARNSTNGQYMTITNDAVEV